MENMKRKIGISSKRIGYAVLLSPVLPWLWWQLGIPGVFEAFSALYWAFFAIPAAIPFFIISRIFSNAENRKLTGAQNKHPVALTGKSLVWSGIIVFLSPLILFLSIGFYDFFIDPTLFGMPGEVYGFAFLIILLAVGTTPIGLLLMFIGAIVKWREDKAIEGLRKQSRRR